MKDNIFPYVVLFGAIFVLIYMTDVPILADIRFIFSNNFLLIVIALVGLFALKDRI